MWVSSRGNLRGLRDRGWLALEGVGVYLGVASAGSSQYGACCCVISFRSCLHRSDILLRREHIKDLRTGFYKL